jgi:hypothetical protein
MDKSIIKARFFGAHIGCKVLIDEVSHQINAGCVFRKPNSQSAISPMPFLNFYLPEQFGAVTMCAVDRCKLVLRPLSSITDTEAIDVLTMATGLRIVEIERDSDKIVGVGMGRSAGNIISGGGNVAMWLKISPLPVGRLLETWNSQGGEPPECMDYIAIDYLRSINICVPFCGYEPIAEGWAILEEKIPANH